VKWSTKRGCRLSQHLGGGLLVEDHVDRVSGGDLALDGSEDTDDLLVLVVAGHAVADHHKRRVSDAPRFPIRISMRSCEPGSSFSTSPAFHLASAQDHKETGHADRALGPKNRAPDTCSG
jgi:hypothetical protein